MAKEHEKPNSPPASPPVSPPPVPPVSPPPPAEDSEVALLRKQVADQGEAIKKLERLLDSGAVNNVDAKQKEKSEAELEAFKIEIAKGRQRITQEAADKAFPGGKHRYTCHLPDGNDLPEIGIGADNEVDAAARYLSVCGVKSSDKQVTVTKA